MTSPAHPRQPKGQPTGGQFAPKSNPEAELELTGWDTGASPVLQGEESRSHCLVARHSTHSWLV